MITSAVLLVSPQGAVSTLTTMLGDTRFSHVADAGDRYVVAVGDSSFSPGIELRSIGYAVSAPPPFVVHTFPRGVGNLFGLGVDANGDLIVGLDRSPESLVRIPHAPDAALQPIAGGTATPYCFALVQASGLVISAAYPVPSAQQGLVLTDTVAGTATNWTAPIDYALHAVAVRADPRAPRNAVAAVDLAGMARHERGAATARQRRVRAAPRRQARRAGAAVRQYAPRQHGAAVLARCGSTRRRRCRW